jgi:site-specific DNA recombinase
LKLIQRLAALSAATTTNLCSHPQHTTSVGRGRHNFDWPKSDGIVVHLAESQETNAKGQQASDGIALHITWQKMPSKRRREILVPDDIRPQQARLIRSENRATLIASIARGRRWLDELMTDAKATAESIAKREGFSARKVNMMISLAFLAPDLVRAAIEGQLPHGMGVTRLVDLPAEWSRQHQMLGLPPQ